MTFDSVMKINERKMNLSKGIESNNVYHAYPDRTELQMIKNCSRQAVFDNVTWLLDGAGFVPHNWNWELYLLAANHILLLSFLIKLVY